jgi:lipoate-protein ligase A
MQFFVIPFETQPAAANMSTDLMLLDAFPESTAVRLRSYGWSEMNAFTFGYSQSFQWILKQTGVQNPTLIRRPSGGGLVDHRSDFTYALVIPPNHKLHKEHPDQVYALVHKALAEALCVCGQPATLAPARKTLSPESSGVGICFAAPEPSDVIDPVNGLKIAGAAMKRNQNGLLLQGYIEKKRAPHINHWDWFLTHFSEICAVFLQTDGPITIPAPEYPLAKLEPLLQRFSSIEWNQKR